MESLATLGIAANVFAIMGLVDVISRTGTSVYSILRSNPAAEITPLLVSLKSLISVVADCRSLVVDLTVNPAPGDHTTLSTIIQILKDCETDIKCLNEAAGEVLRHCNGNWYGMLTSRISFAWQRYDTAKARQKLEAHKTCLSSALLILVSRKSLHLHTSVQGTGTAIEEFRQEASTHLQTIVSETSEISQLAVVGNNKLSSIEAQVDKVVSQQFGLTSQLDSLNLKTSTLENHLRKSQKLQADVSNQMATLLLSNTGDGDFFLQGVNVEAILLPLMCLRSTLPETMAVLLSAGKLKLNRDEMRWLLGELDNLIASSHRTAQKWNHKSSPSAQSAHTLSKADITEIATSSFQKRSVLANYLQRAGAGTVIIKWRREQEEPDDAVNNTLTLQLSFLANPDLAKIGLCLLLQKHMETTKFRRFRMFNIIESSSLAVQSIRKNDFRTIQDLFQRNQLSPFDRDRKGQSLLYHAVSSKSLDVVELLLQEGSDPLELCPSSPPSRFLEILWRGWLSLVQRDQKRFQQHRRLTMMAMKKGAEVEFDEGRGNLLHTLSGLHNTQSTVFWDQVVTFVRDLGCSLHMTDEKFRTPFIRALDLSRTPDWEFLDILSQSVDPEDDFLGTFDASDVLYRCLRQTSYLHYTHDRHQEGHVVSVLTSIIRRIPLQELKYDFVFIEAMASRRGILTGMSSHMNHWIQSMWKTAFVGAGLNSDEAGQTIVPQDWLTLDSHLEFEVEIDAMNGYGRTPLMWAVEKGHDAVVKLLLKTGKISSNWRNVKPGRSPQMQAVEKEYETQVKLLLETEKMDVNTADEYGYTPLSWAAHAGLDTVVKLLLETDKVDVNTTDRYGRTPLSWASQAGHDTVVKLLLETDKFDVNTADEYGYTPLSRAAQAGHDTVVKLLLEKGQVDIDVKSGRHGRTPLSLAAEKGHKAVVKLLLETGKVDVDAIDKLGRRPLWWAVNKGHQAVVKQLQPRYGLESFEA